MSRLELVVCRTGGTAMLPAVFMVFLLLGIIQASWVIEADIQPKDPWFFVGYNMTVSCRLINPTSREDSSRMHFSFEGKKSLIPSEYVEVINASTIQLTYPLTKLVKHQYLGCYLNRTDGTLKGLGFTHINSDYPPEKVKNISCVVDDWKTMTCSWDLEHTYSKHTKVQLWWKTHGNKSRCPELTTNTCIWDEKKFERDEDYEMYITVSSRSPLQIVTEKSETFVVDSRAIVKPAPPHVNVSVLNEMCIRVEVDDREDARKLVEITEFQSQCDEDKSTWNQVNTGYNKTQEVICNLTPFTNYTVRVAVQSQPYGDSKSFGFFSDWWNTTVLTQPSVPAVAPEMCSSCFSILPCNTDKCNETVLIYWKAIPRCLRYSVIKEYHLIVLDGNQNVTNHSIDGTHNSQILSFSSQHFNNYTIKLFAVTKEGNISSNYSKILLSPRYVMTTPKYFVVETDTEYAEDWNSRVFYLRWSSPETLVDKYTIVWCRGSKWRRNCDPDDEVHYEVLPGTATEYKLKIPASDVGRKPDDYMIGIASEARQASSGIIWAPCFHIKDVVPPEVRGVTASPVKNDVEVSWLHRGCDFDYKDSRAYISNYSITYCSTVSGSICSGSEHKEVVNQSTTRYTLENLKPGTKYLIQVTAFSQHGQGPAGKVEVEIPVNQNDASADTHWISITLALIVIITIIILGTIYLKRRCKKKLEKLVFECPRPSFQFPSQGYVSKPYVPLNKKNIPENTELLCLLNIDEDSSNSDALDRVDHQLTQMSARPGLRPHGQSGSVSTDQAYNSMDCSSQRDSTQYFRLDPATTTNRVEHHNSRRTHPNPTVRHDAYVDHEVCRVQCPQNPFYNGTDNSQNKNSSYPQLSGGNTTYVQAALPSLTQQKGTEYTKTDLPLPSTQSTSHSVPGSSSKMYVSSERLASHGDTTVSQHDASQHYVSLPLLPVVLPYVADSCQPTNISPFVTPSNMPPDTSYVHNLSSLQSNLHPEGEQITSKPPSLLRETTPYISSSCNKVQSTQNLSYVFMPPSTQNNVTMGYVNRGDA